MRELESIKGALASIPGVTYSPSIPQAALAREFQGSSILGYPNTFAETSCITAMEAMYAGCVPLTTNRAALGETVGDGGVLVEGTPGNPLYDDQFVAEAVRLLTDDQYWQRLSQRAVQIAQNYTWDAVAEALLSRLAVSGVAS
ncbi:MAG: glycosyltransferase [Proteobacteria bacterium]|nr:glycosyltransferase [Pseudomonadota bacterium]